MFLLMKDGLQKNRDDEKISCVCEREAHADLPGLQEEGNHLTTAAEDGNTNSDSAT
jgi:hypothetical protein